MTKQEISHVMINKKIIW